MTHLKVEIQTAKDTLWGYVYLQEDQRLSDLMNDDRLFLPVQVLVLGNSSDYKQVVIKKDFIDTIREIK